MPNANNVPSAQNYILTRPRVDADIERAFISPLIVVHAGAGFGKTMAVSQYLSERPYRTVWVPFSIADNMPLRFWDHLTTIFAQKNDRLGEKMKQMDFPETMQMFEQFLIALSEELYHDEETVVFVFDNLHVIEEPAVLTFLYYLISAGMENSHIVLITREWPVFTQQLPVVPHVISSTELRFTKKETEEFLILWGLHLSRAALQQVDEYVAGWPVALSLVALAIQRGAQPLRGDIDLSVTKPTLFALFDQEIFSQYTPAEQDLVIKLSVSESFPRGLVQAITDEEPREIAQLLNGNIFIQYDVNDMRLSFHPFYLEFLQDKLQSIKLQERNETYEEVADWCFENGHYYDAVVYYNQCGQYAKLWEALQRIEAERHSYSRAAFLIAQIKKLPEEFKEKHPMTRIVLAMMLANNLFFREAAETLKKVENEIFKNEVADDNVLGEYYTARGLLAFAREENGFEVYFEQAAKLLPNGSSRWNKSVKLVDLGPGIHLRNPDAGELEKSLHCFEVGTPYMAQVMHGAGSGLGDLCKSEALFLMDQTRDAIESAYQAVYTAYANDQFDIVGNALFVLVRIYFAQGKYKLLLETLDFVAKYKADERASNQGIWDIIQSWFYADIGELEKVAPWVRDPVQEGFAPISLDRAIQVRLRSLIGAEQYAEALALSNQFEMMAKRKSSVINLIHIYLGRAIIYEATDNKRGALLFFKRAYDFAAGNKLFMPFVEYGNRTRVLCERALAAKDNELPESWLEEMRAKSTTYAKRQAYIIGKYRREHNDFRIDFGLSAREVELMINLSHGLTREETAEAMQISINTVKSMTKQVFSKLGAINAADAVRIATANQVI